MPVRFPVALITAALLALAPAAAHASPAPRIADRPGARAASHIQGKRWPGRRITYWNGSKANRVYVARAAKAWNTSGIRVRFVPARSKRRAQVWIHQQPGFCFGFAQIGYSRYVRHANVDLSGTTCQEEQTVLVAHELGHILGLGHEDRFCALMNSTVQGQCTRPRDPWRWRCRVIERDDLRAALRLYGGHARKLHRTYCDRWAPPGAPTKLATAVDAQGRPVIGWTNSTSAHLRSVRIDVYASCARTTGLSLGSQSVAVKPGRRSRTVLDLDYVGPACLVLRSEDEYARGRAAAPRPVTFPNHPPVAAFGSEVVSRADVQFSDASTDDENAIVAWRWSFGDGGSSTEQYPLHRYARGGTYTVALTVRDKHGATGTVKHTVSVIGAGTPVARFTVSKSELSVSTDATTSFANSPDGWSSFTWEWGDGSPAESGWDTAYHDYAAAGTYPVRLTVVNADGGSAVATESVTVP